MLVNAFNFCYIFVRELKLSCADVLFDLLGVASANNCRGHGSISQNPRNRDLTRWTPVFLTDFSQALY